MKKIIKQVLEELGDTQINLGSEASRETIASLLSVALKSNGTYMKNSEVDKQVEREREKWVCDICGKNTFDVDYDYIGSGTNHLGCEFEDEKRVTGDRRERVVQPLDHSDRRKGDRREKVFNQAVLGDSGELTEARIQANSEHNDGWTKQHYKDLVEKYEKEKEKAKQHIDRLSEEIVDNKDAKYIYESPDGGETVYRRKFGEDKRELVDNDDWEKLKNYG